MARQLIPLVLEILVTLPFFFFLALFIDPWTAGLFFLTFPITPFLLYLIGRVTGKASAREWNHLSKLTANFSELLAAIPSLKMWNQTEGQITRLSKLSDDFSSSSLSVLRLAFVSAFVLELITTLSIALIAVSIGLRLINGMITFFPAFYALLLAPLFYQPLRESGLAFHAGVHAIAAYKELALFLDDHPAEKPRYTATTQMPPGFTLDHVSFSYTNRASKALYNISLHIPANRITVLTGTSGIGKSTVLRLLAGFSTPTEGVIYLNDLPLHSIDPEFYTSRIAYIPQDPYIFRATLRENITMEFGQDASSMPCAPTDEKILSALQDASLSYLATPRGLQSRLGQGAVTLSFGERRRLGLARAIYQDAPIWLLDEITAGLDRENEAMILSTLEAYKKCRTIVMTAHRPTVLAIADTIINIEAEVSHA
ncbi:hypothetical protein TAMA11512_14330 [Selenomonas sp. TAMA-11512]|nr:hypothetical protein TAMA11512_14330 [Selenomonas sp. TAMA-11512]